MPIDNQLERASDRAAHEFLITGQASTMTNCVFVQLRCRPGSTYRVADALALKELHSELYSTSGEWDLLMKVYIPEGQDVGRFINDQFLDIDEIERSLTTLTFKAF